MTIERVDLLPFSIPLHEPLKTARTSIDARAGWLVRIVAVDGWVGVGEAAPHPHSPPAQVRDELPQMRALAARLEGLPLDAALEHVARARVSSRWIACGFDTALWDLRARSRGVSVASLLGVRRSAVPINGLLGASSIDGCLREAEELVARGFTHAKRKVAHDEQRAAAEVTALGEAFPELKIRLDANGRWTPAEAYRACTVLCAPNVEWIEQPVAPGDEDVAPMLRADTGVRIALDESICSADDARALIEQGACDALVLKLVQVGGISEAVRVAEVAAESAVPVAVTSAFDTGVGLAAALAVAEAVPGPLAPCGLATGPLLDGDVVANPFDVAPMVGGTASQGLGVVLESAVLENGHEPR